MEDDKKTYPLKDECWCVSFSLNDEIQDDVCFFDTEKKAYEYCKEKAEQYSEESGRDLFNVSIYDPDEREVELYIGDDYFHWWYSKYDIREELKKLGIDYKQYSFLN